MMMAVHLQLQRWEALARQLDGLPIHKHSSQKSRFNLIPASLDSLLLYRNSRARASHNPLVRVEAFTLTRSSALDIVRGIHVLFLGPFHPASYK